MKKIYAILILLLLIMPIAIATEGHIPLLALLTKDNANKGIIASLDLEIVPGEEKIYLHTFPMTQVSTQVSMRFAEQIACNEFELDCTKYDFLYTINAVPGIIGGPSAGAAAAVLTAAMLLNKTVNQEIAITGTINSGGLIGIVSGLDKKLEAAAENGIKEVLIPFGTSIYNPGNNLTIDLKEYGRELNITVTEVATLQEAAEKIAGIKKRKTPAILRIDERYLDKMQTVAERLCDRTEQLKEEIEENATLSETNYTAKAKESFEKEDYYSAASYCFRENVELRKKIFKENTQQQTEEILNKISYVMKKQEEDLKSRQIKTLTDIETYMAVMERLEETETLIKQAREDQKNAVDLTALATERLYSANAWSEFFDLTYDTRIIADEEKIKESCTAKISEAEERFNYVKITFKAEGLGTIKNVLDDAYEALNSGDNIMCLYKASKVKAESDVLLGLRGISDANFNKTMELKLNAARDALAETLTKGAFPIIAYSYYEYAQNLFNNKEPISALFAEYALELASIDLYFKEPKQKAVTVIKGESIKELEKARQKQEYLWKVIVTTGLIMLLLLVWFFYELGTRKRDKKIKEMIRKRKKKSRK